MSKTIEEQIETAVHKVDRCEGDVEDAQADLDAAESALEEAEAELEALEEVRDMPGRAAEEARVAALVEGRAGPQRPIRDRAIRTVCGLDEIPQAYAAKMRDGTLVCLTGEDGGKWASNGHWMIRVNSIDGLTPIRDRAENVIGHIRDRVMRDHIPTLVGTVPARTFGKIHAQLEYTSLIEDLFPGIEWHARADTLDPIQAIVNGTVVAIVMPMRGTS